MSFAALALRARAANDTTRAQINNIPSKSHVIPLLIMKKKVSLSQNFYLGCVYIPSCEAHKHCKAEIAQYRLEIIFKVL